MSDLITVASLAVIVLAGVSLTLTIRNEVKRRQRDKTLDEALQLATDALKADQDKNRTTTVRMAEIDPQSPLGKRLVETLGLDQPCGCPNCEEERRIAHANQQRGEK